MNNNNKELNSLTKQVKLFFLIPSCLCIIVGILFGASKFIESLAGLTSFLKFAFAPVVILCFLGGYLMAFNTIGFQKVGPPNVDVVNITVANSYVGASTSREYSTTQQITIIANVVLAALCIAVVAMFGWLLYILYKKDKFLFKIKLMAYKTDEAEELLKTKSTDVKKLGESIHYMTEYTKLYTSTGDRNAARKMLDRAKALLSLMQQVAN